MKRLIIFFLVCILSFGAITQGTVITKKTVRWNSSPTNEYVVKYNVYWQDKTILNAPTNYLSARTNFCIIRHLEVGHIYNFWVKAENQWGQEGNSSAIITNKIKLAIKQPVIQ
jgi:hypothetical protein